MLVGIQNLLELINENWTLIIIIIGLGLSVYRKVKKYLALSEKEKVDLAMSSLKEIVLNLCITAELDWENYKKSGSVKRSEVINKIFKEYPILSKVTNQKEIIDMIDEMIDEALIEVRDLVDTKENPAKECNE